MDEDFAWQLMLQGSPAEVFESLIRAADAEGGLHDVDELEASLTFAVSGVGAAQVGGIRATVRSCPEGALLDITPINRHLGHEGAVAQQAESVVSLIGQLRRYYPHQVVVSAP